MLCLLSRYRLAYDQKSKKGEEQRLQKEHEKRL